MRIPEKPRYAYACQKSAEFLLDSGSNTLPLNILHAAKKYKWALTPYSQLAAEHHVTIGEVCGAFQSYDGYTVFHSGNYCIAYNDSRQFICNKKRIYFTLLHEFGHIYLHHFTDFDQTMLNRNGLSGREYQVLEEEANCFARNVAAPPTLIQHLQDYDINRLSELFNLSFTAAKTRLYTLHRDAKYFLPEQNLNLSDRFDQFLNGMECEQCGRYFVSPGSNFCVFCGSKRIRHSRQIKGLPAGIRLNADKQAAKCVKCGNVQINPSDTHCRFCGTALYNDCAPTVCDVNGAQLLQLPCSERTHLDGYMRYCPYCGNETTFLQEHLLTT